MCLLLEHKFKVHQVVWLWHKGELPIGPLDHIDRNRMNNRIENLRLANATINQLNKEAHGVTKNPRGLVHYARLTVGGKKVTVGRAATHDEATALYAAARSRQLRAALAELAKRL